MGIHLQMEPVMHIQQHIVERQQVAHINMEMPHMKRVAGIAITPPLWFRTTLSSPVVVTITMGLMLGYSTSSAAMGTIAAASASVSVSQYSNVKSVI